jgi:Uncharacterized conserved protein (some members contain a von Willebrand factor type A (vWA) domain)
MGAPQSAFPIPPSKFEGVRGKMRAASERLSLPLKLGLRRTTGHVAGSGAGSSIDFQDHRPYVPGDDPRHIDWQAYARSGTYTMKLYREEVRPLADLVLDASPSMFFDPAKANRTWELAWFCLESALRAGAAVRLFSLRGAGVVPHEATQGWTETAFPDEAVSPPPELHRIPWRAASLRVFISDLLFPVPPDAFIPPLLSGRGRAVILAPHCRAEGDPDWLGNTELLDCESPARGDFHFRPEDLRFYTETYRQHFDLWRVEARRHGIPFASVAAEPDFLDALSLEGIPSGAVALN